MSHTTAKTLERKAYVKVGATRIFFAATSILFQFAFAIYYVSELSVRFPWISTAVAIVALLIAVIIYGRHENAGMKMMWMLLIMAFPLLGILLYLLTGLSGTSHAMRRRFISMDNRLQPYLPEDTVQQSELKENDSHISGQFHYIRTAARFPVYDNTHIEFYADANLILKQMQEDLKSATSFIFMEYYAIEDGIIFESLLDILSERVKAGVEVRLFYDDIGSVFFVNKSFAEKMEKAGIKCRIFNPMLPLANIFMNNRDHRKMTIIDGKIAYTGGYNLADEYFNLTSPYGHWKDTGVRIEGGAAASMTYMFLETWNTIRGEHPEDQEFHSFFPTQPSPLPDAGYVQPYGDSPLAFENVGENVYMNILSSARQYCWFTTPYLIITDEMVRCFQLAAGRGVDVRIITPGIPDKKMVYRVTRSSYHVLAQSGIRIYEYTPGFCHAKQCVADDEMAICGTINLDYRSLYHHFEDGVLMYHCDAVHDIRRDFDALLPQCHEVTEQYARHVPFPVRIWETILRLLAPLI